MCQRPRAFSQNEAGKLSGRTIVESERTGSCQDAPELCQNVPATCQGAPEIQVFCTSF
jgi:hypothetical protein